MNRYFDIKNKLEVNKSAKASEPQSKQWANKYLSAHYTKVQKLEESLFRLPTTEEFIFLQTDNAFNAFTFIPFVAKREPIQELFASTYSISRRVVDSLVEMHDCGMIEQITLLISDSMIKRNAITIEHIRALAQHRANMQVFYAWTHAKISLMKTAHNYYIVEGSGNWSENAHFEQYLLANSVGLYDFRKELFTDVSLKKY